MMLAQVGLAAQALDGLHGLANNAGGSRFAAFAEALRRELLDTGVTVSYIAPRVAGAASARCGARALE